MTGNPTDVGGAPIDVTVVIVEYESVGHGRVQQVAARAVLHALGLSGAAGGVENEKRVFGVHRLAFALGRLAVHQFVVPDVATVAPRYLAPGAAHGEYGMHVGTLDQGLLGVFLERDDASAANSLVCRDHHPAVRVQDAFLERLRGEAAEHDGVHGADARACQHCVGGLRHHRHVDADAVALAHSPLLQRVCEARHFVAQLAIGD